MRLDRQEESVERTWIVSDLEMVSSEIALLLTGRQSGATQTRSMDRGTLS